MDHYNTTSCVWVSPFYTFPSKWNLDFLTCVRWQLFRFFFFFFWGGGGGGAYELCVKLSVLYVFSLYICFNVLYFKMALYEFFLINSYDRLNPNNDFVLESVPELRLLVFNGEQMMFVQSSFLFNLPQTVLCAVICLLTFSVRRHVNI